MSAGRFYVVFWPCQQAVEKALKALYIDRQVGRVPPRIHDLVYLGARVGAPPSINTDLIVLLPTFDLARYPGPAGVAPVDAIGQQDAGGHLAAAERIAAWIASQL